MGGVIDLFLCLESAEPELWLTFWSCEIAQLSPSYVTARAESSRTNRLNTQQGKENGRKSAIHKAAQGLTRKCACRVLEPKRLNRTLKTTD